ncbi:hypothetical protein ACNSOS_09710 [Aliarcobacter vitoriensis]|uniref:hypothetical protein n=1 Tax=Aliarcobacter vitoriensis TaxID=2011099 RepID=UPI003AADE9B3
MGIIKSGFKAGHVATKASSGVIDGLGKLTIAGVEAVQRNNLKKTLTFQEISSNLDESIRFLENYKNYDENIKKDVEYLRKEVDSVFGFTNSLESKKKLEKDAEYLLGASINLGDKIYYPKDVYSTVSGADKLEVISKLIKETGLYTVIEEFIKVLNFYNSDNERVKIYKGECTQEEYDEKIKESFLNVLKINYKVTILELSKLEELKKLEQQRLQEIELEKAKLGRPKIIFTVVAITIATVFLVFLLESTR